ncbi:DUF4240 domain-containing protein [Kitasatospora sp. NPDC101155]|uniref:DUF4240 domain-containing protein n=1 Tax=Kitasatospora sp. NPDC101155 TaxID=3364097 RepID=UPI00380338EF
MNRADGSRSRSRSAPFPEPRWVCSAPRGPCGQPAAWPLDYDERFSAVRESGHRWDVCAACYLIGGWFSDDGFIDFRAGLISLGREWFERVATAPDSLADYPLVDGSGSVDDLEEALLQEDANYAALRAYDRVTGVRLSSDLPLDVKLRTSPRRHGWRGLRRGMPAEVLERERLRINQQAGDPLDRAVQQVEAHQVSSPMSTQSGWYSPTSRCVREGPAGRDRLLVMPSIRLSGGRSLLPPAGLVEDRLDSDDAEGVHGLVRAVGVEEADQVAEEAFAVLLDVAVLGGSVADGGEPVSDPEQKFGAGGDDDRRGVLAEAGGVAIGSATDVVGTVGRSRRWGGHPQRHRGTAHPVSQIRPVGRPQSRVLTGQEHR